MTRANIDTHILSPLRSANLSVFFHTYRSGCAERDKALVGALQPAAHQFSSRPLARSVESYVRVVQLALHHPTPSDILVLLRFDVSFTTSITSLPLRWTATNLPSAMVPDWRACDMVHDLFMVVPRAMGPAFCEALDLMGRANATVEEVVRWSDWPATKAGKCAALVSGFTSRGDLGGAHFIAPPLRRLLGAASVHAFSPLTPRGAFASIERSCGPAMAA